MVKLDKIYTRGGDKGETSLTDGTRAKKYAPRVEAYGSIDESNAIIGIARLHTSGAEDDMLGRIQNDLFDLGADVSLPHGTKFEEHALRVTDEQVTRLENEIDQMNEDLSPLKSFTLPGGSAASAYLHQARTVVRRSERLLVRVSEEEEISDIAIKYLNRLSDHLFVMSRKTNNNGTDDVLWVPGKNR
ncbi:cob(I)yrinic acid a,c-diamide adenosyltransferase [Pseudemcibacter aquimaris]|uniref:cob(I)yrinic acid a,c-diamide adenosyltransferase n=1 Tax=Pseudemcibacter aquimaris TaxID=2857064 RepID=UPI002013BD58|nr:cob(I)yrinic acid a,c-diamide adenosyltransferase [Pseudemcibacter aquimaris]MCC3862078.1 cob(I)yrinic acid a,c-diamide adenosyltransferase [Pseudemcibacter aquimaris]WDU58831.1 cob(I)yrinic acid a,c-diamide adenosyltransferase [Pseudemcibacter aquimaris]